MEAAAAEPEPPTEKQIAYMRTLKVTEENIQKVKTKDLASIIIQQAREVLARAKGQTVGYTPR